MAVALACSATFLTPSRFATTAFAAEDPHDSIVDATGEGSDGANIRSCPGLPNQGQTIGCGVEEHIPNQRHVRMHCWESGNPPPGSTNAKWFWVTDVDGPNPGRGGYMWSQLVVEQWLDSPECTWEIIRATLPSDPVPGCATQPGPSCEVRIPL